MSFLPRFIDTEPFRCRVSRVRAAASAASRYDAPHAAESVTPAMLLLRHASRH